jgi:hypothetical protein
MVSRIARSHHPERAYRPTNTSFTQIPVIGSGFSRFNDDLEAIGLSKEASYVTLECFVVITV